jgi:hypothetical protein
MANRLALIMSRPFDAAWRLLKGDYDTDMAQAERLDSPDTQLEMMQRMYNNRPLNVPWASAPPEDYAPIYLSQIATSQGVQGANIGEPNFHTSQGHSDAKIMRDAVGYHKDERFSEENPYKYPSSVVIQPPPALDSSARYNKRDWQQENV